MMATMAIATTAMHRAISIMVNADCRRGGWDAVPIHRRQDGFHETGWPGILISAGRV
jgi:hypothetical protein